jgi:hypothetical protein
MWRNPTVQFVFLLAKMAKASAIVANDGGIINLAKYGETDEITAKVSQSVLVQYQWQE